MGENAALQAMEMRPEGSVVVDARFYDVLKVSVHPLMFSSRGLSKLDQYVMAGFLLSDSAYSSAMGDGWVPMPDPIGEGKVDVKVVDHLLVKGPISENNCIDIKKQCMDYFPAIREVLKDPSTHPERFTDGSVATGNSLFPPVISTSAIVSPPKAVVKGVDGTSEGESSCVKVLNSFHPTAKYFKELIVDESAVIKDYIEHVYGSVRPVGSGRADKEKIFEASAAMNATRWLDIEAGWVGQMDMVELRPWTKEVLLGILAISSSAGYTSPSGIAKALCAMAFVSMATAFWLPRNWKRAIRALMKFGAIACIGGVLAAIGDGLPFEYKWWAAALAFLAPATAVAMS